MTIIITFPNEEVYTISAAKVNKLYKQLYGALPPLDYYYIPAIVRSIGWVSLAPHTDVHVGVDLSYNRIEELQNADIREKV